MRDFFRSWRFKILVVIACLLLGLMLRTASSGGFSTLSQKFVSVVIMPIQKVSAQISSAASNALSGLVSYNTLKKENTQLKNQVRQLTSQMVNYDSVLLQNQQYKDYLGIKEENPDQKYLSAMVISHDPGPWFSSFTIDKGSLDGVQKNDPVITGDGVVGIVTKVLPTSSRVTTIVDPSTEIGATVSHTGDVCISCGSLELYAKNQMEFIDIPRDSAISKGDIVVTSGFGGIYPKGLKIGTVQSIQLDTDGMTLYAVAQPFVDPSKVKSVFIITDFNGKASDVTSSQSSQSTQSGTK